MKTIFLTLTLLISSFVSVFANTSDLEAPNDEKSAMLMKKVQKAEKNDWVTLKDAALFTINWNGDLEIAKQWIDKAIKIDKNALTLEVLGDYYIRTGNVEKATETYFNALEEGVTNLGKEDMERIQRKVLVYARMK
ncbi:hypothetical protein [Flammeovirga sp. SJP92]|uniref:hypothetical protein n=1 Tax=Flammeovirga sp. SJP92 TaxID=1775430 RepID=UPI000788FA0E|nr:hypothetical protein [Flammeovirga sp. SJP92]KXX68531.1 hypothetical protein AVL50_22465 [Flammeovirga sp. SJP92]